MHFSFTEVHMKPLSMDLKERILAAILNDKETMPAIAVRFSISHKNGAKNKVPISGHRHFATPVSLRPNGTTDWRLKRYQLIPHPRFSSDGRLSIPKSVLREPHCESTGDGQVLCNQQLTISGLFRTTDRPDPSCVTWSRPAAFAGL